MNIAPRWWTLEDIGPKDKNKNAARCDLCIHACLIPEGKSGFCRVRLFDGKELRSPYLGRFSSIAVDPIEKKPLYHWRPGSLILSLGSIGCNMRCPFCQNCSIAQPDMGRPPALTDLTPEKLVETARRHGLEAVAYTYNEPALQGEYILAAAPILREAGIATVLVTNGIYTQSLLNDLAPIVDAANVDLKAFNEEAYKKMGGSLQAVQRAIEHFFRSGTHLEVTTLVVPGLSDSPEEFAEQCSWLASVSPEIPLHISRYRPAHTFTAPPTPIAVLEEFAGIARAKLRHVHIGNVPELRQKT